MEITVTVMLLGWTELNHASLKSFREIALSLHAHNASTRSSQ
jgi:hypothetical protein